MPTVKIKDQTLALKEGHVFAIQRWTGFGTRQGFVVSRDGEVTTQRAGTSRLVCRWYRDAVAGFTPDQIITLEQARTHLAHITGRAADRCPACRAELPIAGRWCESCGQPPARGGAAPAASSMEA